MDPRGTDWDDTGLPPYTAGGFFDHFALNNSVYKFGNTVGEADAGCAALSDEVWAGAGVAGNVALLFLPGGEEARGAEVGAELAENAGRDAAQDVAEHGCNLCLAAGTPVWTPTGAVAIQSVQVGDRVVSRDPATGQDSVRTVTATVSRPAPALVTLSLSDPASGKAEDLACTPEHPLYVTGKGWVEAGDLGVGTSIVTRAGPPVVVQSVDWQRDETGKRPFTVYNLTVQGDHTYFAGELDGGVWAHNICKINTVQLTRGVLKEDKVLDRALEWLGPGYKESMGRTGMGGEGVFRSADNLRQFRMAPTDLLEKINRGHGNIGPHVHFQAFDQFGNELENAHIQVIP